MYTTTSKQQEGSRCKDTHPKCFISFLPTAYADISYEMFVYLKTNQDKVLPLNLVCREENYNILVLLNDY